ncbi:MAG: mrdB [Patescibacteria group bacterium]|nr:mrdB [Patescibacteria group bacterium]
MFQRLFRNIDWILIAGLAPILLAGLVTMASFGSDGSSAWKQLMWIAIAFLVMFAFAAIDTKFFKKTEVLVALYGLGISLLGIVFVVGHISKGAARWISFGGFSLQPADPMKLILILILAKYLSRRHIEIRNPKHIFITAAYMFVPFVLVFFQPDFGSALILAAIWFGLMLASGISKKHLAILFTVGIVSFSGLWLFVFRDYQKARIENFINPTADIRNTGYHVYQSMIAVGSGQVWGKGVGYGTQSRLNFLPEYKTDFIFAAFAEEWGLIGCIILIASFSVVIWRILKASTYGSSNFEILFALGIAMFLMSHIIVNMGMNIGIMPVTGIALPFMSYGGSHLLTEFAALGILMSMRGYRRSIHRDDTKHEFLGM